MNIERNLLERINAFVLDKHLTISDVAYFFEMETEINETFLEVRELLAQPETEQKPVVWQVIGIAGFMYVYNKPIHQVYEHHVVIPLYTAPPNREPLSDERLTILVDKYHGYPKTLGRAIEKAHGIGVDDE